MDSITLTQTDTNQERQLVFSPQSWQDFVSPKQTSFPIAGVLLLSLQDTTTSFYGPPSRRELLIQDNLQDHETEPEDMILVTSGILPRLITRAKQEPPSLNWERDLDEL